ncbi:MAG TPA: LCP family protein [Candidatus Limnocylindria bacterium]|nr:LCP family protein [Candidatus Limnocylindria bacterium]
MSNEGSRQPLALAPGLSLGSPGLAALLSALLPGLGQVYQERWIKGGLMLLLPVAALVAAGALIVNADPLMTWVLRNAMYVTFLVIATIAVYHLFVVADAFAGRMHRLRGRHLIDYTVLALVTVALVLTYGTIYRESAPWAAFFARFFAPIVRQQPVPLPPRGEDPAPAWSGKERLNVLVLGIDTRDGDRTTQNTDTMIVVSLDPLNQTAAMLSLPRDIYINRPGTFQGKINAAFAVGGPDLARRVTSDLLGIRIHSFALVNFEAFNRVVNGVGGVIVDVRRPVRDEYFPTVDYGVERLNIAAGPQLMFGDTALKYARSRHDSNDYSRARRQQDVLGALRAKLSTPQALRTLPTLMDGVATTIETDFDPSNVLSLARTATAIDSEDITSDVLYPCGGDYPHCELTLDNDGGFYLTPDVVKIRDLAASLFYDPKVRQEAARVEVQSAGASSGVARQVADRLEARAFGVSAVTNGASARSAVVLRNSTKRYTAEQLRTQLGLPMETADGAGGPDIVVRIGNDFRSFASDSTR